MPESTNWAPILAQMIFNIVTSLGSFYVGATVAGAQQDRAARKRQSAIAAALVEDLNRIDGELARIKNRGLKPWDGRQRIPAPTVHPWVEGLIAESAEEDPQVVAGFMRLQTALVQMEESAQRAADAYDQLSETHQRLTQLEEHRAEALQAAGQKIEPLPDDRDALLVLASVPQAFGAATATAKLEWQDAFAKEARLLSEYRVAPGAVMHVVFNLITVLVPIAYRPIESLPSLVARTLSPVPEDSELAELEVVRLLRQHGYGYLADRRKAKSLHTGGSAAA